MFETDLVGDEQGDGFRELDALEVGLFLQDGDPGLDVGRLQVGDEPPFEPGLEALLEPGDLLGRAIARDDDLFLVVVEMVEGVEKLLLRPVLADEGVDIVHEEEVDAPVFFPELEDLPVLEVVDDLVHELLGRDVDDPQARVVPQALVADGVHEVGLPEARPAVDVEGIVGPGRVLGHGRAGGVGERLHEPTTKFSNV